MSDAQIGAMVLISMTGVLAVLAVALSFIAGPINNWMVPEDGHILRGILQWFALAVSAMASAGWAIVGFFVVLFQATRKPSPQSTVAFPDEAQFAKNQIRAWYYDSTVYTVLCVLLEFLMHSSAVFLILSLGLATLFVAGVFGPMAWSVAVPFMIFVFGMICAHLVYASASGVLFFNS
jgi:hypothetical protein